MLKLLNYYPLTNAKVPVRSTEGSVGYDVFAYNEKVIPKHSVRRVCIGIKIEMQPDMFAEFKSRSSYVLKNLVVEGGVIDPDYRGLLYVCLRNHNDEDVLIKKDQKIAQLIFYRCVFPDFVKLQEKEKLNETVRNEGGFGSTGD